MAFKKWIHPTGSGLKDVYKWRNFPEYTQWCGMLTRCEINGKYQNGKPSYIGSSVCSDWLSYDSYMEWAKQQVGFLSRDEGGNIFSLDKDILGDSKHYSPETCVFVPAALNSVFKDHTNHKGNLPYGVTEMQPTKKGESRFASQVSLGKEVSKYLGRFNNIAEAHNKALEAKRQHLESLIVKYAGLVDYRVLDKLRTYMEIL